MMRCEIFEGAEPHADGFYEITVDDLWRAARVVDVREPHEHLELAPLAHAEIAPLGELDTHAARWRRDEPLVVVCRSGVRSGRAARQLAGLGFDCVVSLRGGMRAVVSGGAA